MRTFGAGLCAALAAACATPAAAEIFFGTYTPSDTAATVKNVTMPVTYRSASGQSFTAPSGLSAYCANVFCSYIEGQGVTTEFVSPGSFTATHMIVPLSMFSIYNNRYGFSISELDEDSGTWVGLGYMQFESGNIPNNLGAVTEVQVPFGASGAGFVDFNYQPIHFEAGARYRVTASGWAGGVGTFLWHGSGEAAQPGQSIQHTGYQAAFGLSQTNLAWQPAFALTDGGALAYAAPGAVPEPATWLMLITGFGQAGHLVRRRRAAGVSSRRVMV